ncbi:LysR family transcriptional regulator [Mediterraneibacter sp. NSJ-55]|uniref:LysR family transcriptional regulator n=1 Tax=Mediterraneibacter hominis TaxID=2763054 RepID=A0A923LJ28_9FIRM|nr:LysR family transcriptional regulator [Mediterraneibacter hominis]MBC5689022.1 LysR family transcriptional regulator [Mediterraneibacter hominis]
MLNLSELEQLTAFADLGTLSKTAEELHISQPTLTRTMKQIEEAFGVPLFERGKNRIYLNETGLKAVEYARKLLYDAENAVRQVQTFHARLHTILVESCAPAPLWTLLPLLSENFPEQTISSRLVEIPSVIEDVTAGKCEIGILPFPINENTVACRPIIREELFVCVPKEHELAKKQKLTLSALNGFNCLLRSEIGFWNELCREKMPASRFLVQTDEFAFEELARESSLPCFTTNLAENMYDILEERKRIPVMDKEANVTYHMIYKKQKKEYHTIEEQLRKKDRQ